MNNITLYESSWKKEKIRNLSIELIDGDRSSRYPKQHDIKSSGIPFLSTLNIQNNRLDTSNIVFISLEKFQELSKGKLEPLDIIVTTRGSIGKIALFNTDKFETGFINAQMLIIRTAGNQIDQKYLYYYLCSERFQKELNNYASGSAQPQIPIRDLREIEIYYPPINFQRKISKILEYFDKLIENNISRIQILEEMAQLIYREWFVHYRFPGHEDVKMVDSGTEFGEIPDGWEVENIFNITDINYGETLPKKKMIPNSKYPVYGASKIIGKYDRSASIENITLL